MRKPKHYIANGPKAIGTQTKKKRSLFPITFCFSVNSINKRINKRKVLFAYVCSVGILESNVNGKRFDWDKENSVGPNKILFTYASAIIHVPHRVYMHVIGITLCAII